jgi:hypothetical protein
MLLSGMIFRLMQVLSNICANAHRRKNLGYLWAIQHGAQKIYETDDDNELVTTDLPSFEGLQTYVYNGANQTVVNPYAYFGYPGIWPRGYPLDQIRASQQSVSHFSRVASRPLILQGLADKDPDVDAIFRCLSRKVQEMHASLLLYFWKIEFQPDIRPADAAIKGHKWRRDMLSFCFVGPTNLLLHDLHE